MPRIVILDEITANKIAAGEVVERPASVVKELLENSLDAGAGKIDLEIFEGGLKCISVADNGCGMDADDAKLAFLRHATSKIVRVEDLIDIKSLGFRGEALPSIASVSKVSLKTRPPGSQSGTALEIHGGRFIFVQPAGCPAGTSIKVEDIFYNTPARRKHMKKPSTEAGLVSDIVTRVAMGSPGVGIRLLSNGRQVFQSDGSGKLINVLASVYGPELAMEMLPVAVRNSGLKIQGYVSRPIVHRSSKRHINIFVNGRYIKNQMITSAIMEAYQTVLPNGRFPLAVLSIRMDPGSIDVNVHPSKVEIKILNEETLFNLIKEMVKDTLYTREIVPTVSLGDRRNSAERQNERKKPTDGVRDGLEEGLLEYQTETIKQSHDNVSEEVTCFGLENKLNRAGPVSDFPPEIPTVSVLTPEIPPLQEKKIDIYNTEVINTAKPYGQNNRNFIKSLYPIGFLPPTYIVAGGDEGLYIIDQHAAHERIHYERFLKRVNNGEVAVQFLLVPLTLHLSHREAELVRDNIDMLRNLGIIMEGFGGETMVLRGVPAGLPEGREECFVQDVLELLAKPGKIPGKGELFDHLAASAACKAAIKAGTKSSLEEAGSLLNDLSGMDNPYTCPHGRPTVICISTSELSARFKRT